MMTETLKLWMLWLDAHPVAGYYIAIATILWPAMTIFARAGFRRRGALWLLVPFAGYFIAQGLLVFRRWPALQVQGEKP